MITSYAAFTKAKQNNPESLILISKGDFIETFGEDAEIVSRVLRLWKTTRSSDGLVTVGFPQSRCEASISALLRAGYRIGIVELMGGQQIQIAPAKDAFGDPGMN